MQLSFIKHFFIQNKNLKKEIVYLHLAFQKQR